MISISKDRPIYNTYQANLGYIKHLKLNECLFLNIHHYKVSIPLEKKYIFRTKYFDLISPINFQASLSKNFWNKYLREIKSSLQKTNAISCYIQTKDDFIASNTTLCNSQRFITNFYFNLTLSDEQLLQAHKKSSRLKLKKILNDLSYKILTGKPSQEFSKFYNDIAMKKSFSKHYLFSHEQFIGFSIVPNITYIEIRSNNEFVSGGFFGFNNKEVDYLYGAANPKYNDAIRLLIWEAVKLFQKKKFQKLFLGGGITPNDSLSDFKRRMGTSEQKCVSLMMVLNKTKAEEFAQKEFSHKWFQAYFPPYREGT